MYYSICIIFDFLETLNMHLNIFRNADRINQDLLARINSSGKYHMTPAKVRGNYIIRFCVTYEHATDEQISMQNR